jgi:predicted nucleic-acid-binding protein
MIGVDTNVLVRIFVEDDPGQTAVAQAFFRERTAESPAFVSAVVVVEVCWVLAQTYGFGTGRIGEALQWLFESACIVIERHDLLEQAVGAAVEVRASIPDCIIAALATDAGATRTATFDRVASKRVPGMELLT